MNSRMLFYYKIIIFGIILVLTGFVGYLLFVEPNSQTDINTGTGGPEVCPLNLFCEGVDITGSFICNGNRSGGTSLVYCCPEGEHIVNGACVDRNLPLCDDIGIGIACDAAGVDGSTACRVSDSSALVVNCCAPGQEKVNENGVLKCVNAPRNVQEGGACTQGGEIECTSGICCSCGVCGGVSQTCTDLCSPDPDPAPSNPTPTNPTPTDPQPTTPNPSPTNPTPTDPVVPTDPGTDDGTGGGDNTDTDDNSNGRTDGDEQDDDENVSDGLDNLPDTAINLEKDHYFLLYGFVLIFYGLTVSALIRRLKSI